MLTKLFKLANRLDRSGNTSVADEVDTIIKNAIELSPEREKEIEESWNRYYDDPEKQEKNQIEQDYGLGVFSDDENDFGGLEPTPWHGHRWSYEGFPKGSGGKGHADGFKKFERYQTVIGDDSNLPEKIDDPAEGGFWIREQIFDRPNSLSKNDEFQTVYRFVDPAKEQRKKELWGDDDNTELSDFINGINEDDVETPEEIEDVVEVTEPMPSGSGVGGVKLF